MVPNRPYQGTPRGILVHIIFGPDQNHRAKGRKRYMGPVWDPPETFRVPTADCKGAPTSSPRQLRVQPQ